ncbi:hypothetical protein [Pararobbsia alpina]|uniref:hypothetical protein n=1 Tax=Pararobbsia alpina TaxID=621374 RepID=UPI0015832665|nr:hypothetical protein [Pararobbsia alpina]
MTLLVPRIIVDEFQIKTVTGSPNQVRRASAHFDQVKSAIRKADGDKRQKDRILDYLSDLDHRIPILGGAAEGALSQIAAIFVFINDHRSE